MITYSKALRRSHRKPGWKQRLKELNYLEIMPIYRRALDFTRCTAKAESKRTTGARIRAIKQRAAAEHGRPATSIGGRMKKAVTGLVASIKGNDGISRAARFYLPHQHKGARFQDPRGIIYEVREDGSMRVVNKPRSRVKRLREARALA